MHYNRRLFRIGVVLVSLDYLFISCLFLQTAKGLDHQAARVMRPLASFFCVARESGTCWNPMTQSFGDTEEVLLKLSYFVHLRMFYWPSMINHWLGVSDTTVTEIRTSIGDTEGPFCNVASFKINFVHLRMFYCPGNLIHQLESLTRSLGYYHDWDQNFKFKLSLRWHRRSFL
jgi:hypothetical protein